MKQEVYQDEEPYYKPADLAYLEDWVFHFNSFRNEWAAVPRETYNEYWNDYKNGSVLRSKHLNILLDLLHKSKGNKEIIEDIISGEIK
jgi:hypothetical protein